MTDGTEHEEIPGKYVGVRRCKHCNERLFHNEIHRNNGVCPHCGKIGSCGIVDVITESVFVPDEPERKHSIVDVVDWVIIVVTVVAVLGLLVVLF